MENVSVRKRSRRSSSDSSDSSSHKKRKHKKKRKKEKKHKKKSKKHDNDKTEKRAKATDQSQVFGPSLADLAQPTSTLSSATSGKQQLELKPMTKNEWDKQQGELRHVYDAESGRTRLIRGSGEVMEEIVSKERQREINKMATKTDGDFYALKMGTKR